MNPKAIRNKSKFCTARLLLFHFIYTDMEAQRKFRTRIVRLVYQNKTLLVTKPNSFI